MVESGVGSRSLGTTSGEWVSSPVVTWRLRNRGGGVIQVYYVGAPQEIPIQYPYGRHHQEAFPQSGKI